VGKQLHDEGWQLWPNRTDWPQRSCPHLGQCILEHDTPKWIGILAAGLTLASALAYYQQAHTARYLPAGSRHIRQQGRSSDA